MLIEVENAGRSKGHKNLKCIKSRISDMDSEMKNQTNNELLPVPNNVVCHSSSGRRKMERGGGRQDRKGNISKSNKYPKDFIRNTITNDQNTSETISVTVGR